jgi:hypothetical protein
VLEAIYAPLYHVAPTIDARIEVRRSSGMLGTSLASVAPLGDGVRDTPLSQKLSATWEVIPFVGDEMIRALAWPAYTRRTWYPNSIEHTPKLGA